MLEQLFQQNSITPNHTSALSHMQDSKCLQESYGFLVLVAESEVETTKLIQLQRIRVSLSPGFLIRHTLQMHTTHNTLEGLL